MSFPKPFYRWQPHPWHGLDVGPNPPEVITAYIEITPFDVVKYEVEKTTGHLKVDRPQRGASSPPTLYGLIPRTYCGPRVAALSPETDVADGDPLDVCVVSERPINRAAVVLNARVVGGLRMIDGGEADDKIKSSPYFALSCFIRIVLTLPNLSLSFMIASSLSSSP